jgi:hypothetical protein
MQGLLPGNMNIATGRRTFLSIPPGGAAVEMSLQVESENE